MKKRIKAPRPMVSVKARSGKILRVAKMTITDKAVQVVHGAEVRDHLRRGRLLLATADGPQGHRAVLDKKVGAARAKAEEVSPQIREE